ncbi:hypothetical protein D3C81_1683510 [compost metagenome]
MPVAPSAALAIPMDEPLSISTPLFESIVTAAPLVTAMEPPLAKRILFGAVPVAVEVEIGVVRAVEMTVSAGGVVCA